MCARRFLIFVFILTLLVVAGAFAIFQWGGNVLLRQATPKGHFEAAKAGSGPDYTKLDAWIARPDIHNNPSQWLPDNRIAFGIAYPPAAIFYIHPTTYLSTDRWNAPLHADPQTEFRTRLFVQSQASALTSAGHVWAPRYRQAAYGAFLLKSDDAKQALDLAYGDVRSAFDEFLRRIPANQAIILAGHSQGALHLSRLLAERGAALKDRLIAAYVVGWPLSVTADLPETGLLPCARPDQIGCVLSWQTFGQPANPELILDAWEGTKGSNGVERRRRDMLCVNPINGTINGAAAPDRYSGGAIVPSADFKSAEMVPSPPARCDKGFLVVEGEIPSLGPYVLPGNNYHVYDYALFWGYVRDDAERRLRAFERAR